MVSKVHKLDLMGTSRIWMLQVGPPRHATPSYTSHPLCEGSTKYPLGRLAILVLFAAWVVV
eukprot:scaffold590647_cov126-Attheya_sp.AAC.1